MSCSVNFSAFVILCSDTGQTLSMPVSYGYHGALANIDDVIVCGPLHNLQI